MRPHASGPDHTVLHDRLALLKNGGASSSSGAPGFLQNLQQGPGPADISHLHPQGLSVRTGRRPQQELQQGGYLAEQHLRPRSRASTPHRLINTPLDDLLRDGNSFIMPDSAWHGSGGELGGFGMPGIKQEPGMGPGSPAFMPLSMPNSSTFIGLMGDGSGFMHAFGQPAQPGMASDHHHLHQQHHHQHQQQLQHHQLQHHTSGARPLQLPDASAIQRFLQVAAELQRRAQALQAAEAYELDRAEQLRILQPAARTGGTAHMHAVQQHTLLDTFQDPLRSGLHHGLGPSSPGSMALMNCLQPQYIGSPGGYGAGVYASVRLLDSNHNTPAKFGLSDL